MPRKLEEIVKYGDRALKLTTFPPNSVTKQGPILKNYRKNIFYKKILLIQFIYDNG